MLERSPAEVEKVPRKIILDIGSGGYAYFNDIKETIDPNSFYVSIDLSGKVKNAAVEAEAAGVPSASMIADAQRLPVPDGSIDDIVLSDILNSPLLEYAYKHNREPGVNVRTAPKPTAEQRVQLDKFSDEESKQLFIIADNINTRSN